MTSWLVVLLILVAVCSVFLLLFGAVGTLTFFYIRKNLRPDRAELRKELDLLVRYYPFLNADELAKKVIRQNAQKTAIIGGLAGIGGLIIFLLTLPFDLGSSTILQMKMVQLITVIYGNDPEEFHKKNLKLVLGGWGASGVIGFLLKKVFPKVIGESIPVLGGFIGFGVNWLTTKSIGEAAVTWNKGETVRERISGKYRQIQPPVNQGTWISADDTSRQSAFQSQSDTSVQNPFHPRNTTSE